MRLTAIIVEDELLAQKRMLQLLEPYAEEIHIIGTATNGTSAIRQIEQERPDLLFLDIQLPDLSGFQILAKLSYQPLVIFATAYSQYAIQAFETYSIDYLVKPFDAERLAKAIEKLRAFRPTNSSIDYQQLEELLQIKQPKQSTFALPIKIGDRIRLFDFDDLVYFKAEDKYVRIHLKNGKSHLSERSLGKLEERLPEQFIRIHRSYIVNQSFIIEVQKYFKGNLILTLNDKNETTLTTGTKYVSPLKTKLGL